MKIALVLSCLLVACNAIDGADQYKKGDASADASACDPSCISTSATCLESCGSTRDSCKSTCSNPGACNKCDSTYSTCTSGCVTTCTSCGCAAADCDNVPDASTDASSSDASID